MEGSEGSEGCGIREQEKKGCVFDELPPRAPAFSYKGREGPVFQFLGAAAAERGCGAEGSAVGGVGPSLSGDNIRLAVPEAR